MDLDNIYGMVLTLVLIGMIMGVGLLVLGNFMKSPGLDSTAANSINSTINAITPISGTWLPLIVTITVLSIILGLVIRSFVVGRK